jgi:hypothetical protein
MIDHVSITVSDLRSLRSLLGHGNGRSRRVLLGRRQRQLGYGSATGLGDDGHTAQPWRLTIAIRASARKAAQLTPPGLRTDYHPGLRSLSYRSLMG